MNGIASSDQARSVRSGSIVALKVRPFSNRMRSTRPQRRSSSSGGRFCSHERNGCQ